MKKIGIITITDYSNLGNRLQNYAVQEILSKYGHVRSLRHLYGCSNRSRFRIFLSNTKVFLKKFMKCLKNKEKYTIKRDRTFKKFNKYIIESEKLAKNTNYKKLHNKYDVLAVGSDQIWNPNFFNDNMYINMLGFTSNEKKLAIAPSIAVETLSLNQVKVFKELLKDFDYLSCREQQGADLVKKVTGKNCVALIDPTLMLSQEQWNKVSRKPKFHDDNKKYLLLYFLGNMTEEYRKQIQLISDTFNLEIINVADKNSIYYTCGPSEFIYLIKHCEIMLTDSFHGSVFSYIYDKPLRIFKREDKVLSMNSRLINLMNKLNLNDEIYFNINLNLNTLFDVKYDKSYLKNEQDKFNDYLERFFSK